MAGIQARGTLRIGVPADAAPIGALGAPSEPRGMSTDLGALVARVLDVAPEFVAAPSRQLLGRVEERSLDIAFPALPLTESRFRRYVFTDPYVVAHQRVLAAVGHEGAGGRVCAYGDRATATDIEALDPSVTVLRAGRLERCLDLFISRRADAVTADDFFLEYLMGRLRDHRGAPRAAIAGDQLSTVGYAAAVTTGGADLAELVERIFAEAEDDGTWAEIYERWVGAPPDQPPELSAEEAAALFPTTQG